MAIELYGVVGFILLFFLMFIGMPIGFAMAFVGAAGIGAIVGVNGMITVLGTSPYTTVASYEMATLPMFILMGAFAFASGLVHNAFDTTSAFLGRLPGGLAIATIAACGAFAACTGSSVATVSLMSSTALPEMTKRNYDPRLAAGCVAAGSTLGILIPPSIPFVVFGIYAQVSIGDLFISGILPGILLVGFFFIIIIFWTKINPKLAPKADISITWREKLSSLKKFWAVILLALITIGGIWTGIFTPIEAGGAGAFAAFLICIVRGKMNRKTLSEVLIKSIPNTVMIFIIMIGAFIFTQFLAFTNLPVASTEFIHSLPLNPNIIIGAMMLFYLVGGCIMDSFGLMLLSWPVFLPVVKAIGVDFVLFGVLTTVMIEMAEITPPIGINVFVLAGMNKNIPMSKIFLGILPFTIAMAVLVVLLIAFPEIALLLPSTMR
jgi:C4-dicarboxylate transporter, DctM subunit